MKQKKQYLIKHYYDSYNGDNSILLESSFDPTEAAVYLQFKAELLFNDYTICLSNVAIAEGLVALYGLNFTEDEINNETEIDMYYDRERRCGEWFISKEGFEAEELQRADQDIIDILQPFIYDQ